MVVERRPVVAGKSSYDNVWLDSPDNVRQLMHLVEIEVDLVVRPAKLDQFVYPDRLRDPLRFRALNFL